MNEFKFDVLFIDKGGDVVDICEYRVKAKNLKEARKKVEDIVSLDVWEDETYEIKLKEGGGE